MTDELGEFLDSTRKKSEKQSPRIEQIEQIFQELDLPRNREHGGWLIETDVGPVRAGLDEDGKVMTFWQTIHPLKGSPEEEADYLTTLLKINAQTIGACFAIDETEEGEPDWIMLIARISAEQLDKEEVALALEGLLRMSALYEDDQ
jgi:hypothetical protein